MMMQQIATVIFVFGIVGLFALDRDARKRTSKALWLPVSWLVILSSHPISYWLHSESAVSQSDLGTGANPIDTAVYLILVTAAMAVLTMRSRVVYRFFKANLPILLFFFYCTISIIWADYPSISLKRCIKAFGEFLMVLVVLTEHNPYAATKRLFAWSAFVLVPLSVLTIIFYPDFGHTFNTWTKAPMYNGLSENKNTLGMVCLVCSIGSLWSFSNAYIDRMTRRQTRHMIAHGIILVSVVWIFALANSVTSMSCAVMAGAIIIGTAERRVTRRLIFVHAMVAGAVALALFALFFDSGGSLVSSLGRNSTLTGRTAIWQSVLSIDINPLLGTGFESFWTGSRMQRIWDMGLNGIQEAHDGYIEVYLNLGWIGLILLASVIVSGYRQAIDMFRYDAQSARLRLAIFTAGVTYSLSEAGFRMMSPIWFYFLFAMTIIPKNLHRETREGACESGLRPPQRCYTQFFR